MKTKHIKKDFKRWIEYMEFDKSVTSDKEIMELFFTAFNDGYVAGVAQMAANTFDAINELKDDQC